MCAPNVGEPGALGTSYVSQQRVLPKRVRDAIGKKRRCFEPGLRERPRGAFLPSWAPERYRFVR